MRMLEQPLTMTEAENRAALDEAEAIRRAMGDHHGNRHQRRLAAKRERQESRKANRKAASRTEQV